MTDAEWFELFDRTQNTFEWFFRRYHFELDWAELLIYRKDLRREAMCNVMEKVWYELPDDRFNIFINPKGWTEFLNLLEA